MDISEAKAILSDEAYGHSHTAGPKWYEACKLAVEAFNKIQYDRLPGNHPLYDILPGENKYQLSAEEQRLKRGNEILALGGQILKRGDELLNRLTSSS